MPSASAKLEKQTCTDTFDPVKQILTIVEKKVRNLEKRKGKLDCYRHDSASGKELNDDQKRAVEKYDQVVEVLEFTKELQKQFQTVIQDCSKAQRKAAKREQLERQQAELQRIKDILAFQDLLTSMGGDDVRKDFLNGTSGAVKLTEEELNNLDELYKALCPERSVDDSNFEEALSAAADHFQALLDSKSKEVFGTTYKALRDLLQRIQTCHYFMKGEPEDPAEEEPSSELQEEKENSDTNSEAQYSQEPESELRNVVEQISDTNIGMPYYQLENSSLYSEKTVHPIQDVLSSQGNLNFLQESQIEMEASQRTATASVPFSAASHCTRRLSTDAPSLLTLPHAIPVAPSSDFDPARPIPTQTYTNQSFSSAIHPMMAAAVSQSYVPVVTLPHAIPPSHHVLSQSMVVQPLPSRSTDATSNANVQIATTGTSPLSPDCAPQAGVPSSQYEGSNMPEENHKNLSCAFPSARSATRENQGRGSASHQAYARVGYGSDQVYQSTNNSNSSAYMSQENSFTENSSYSSNLKRGLSSRGAGGRGNGVRNNRSGYKN